MNEIFFAAFIPLSADSRDIVAYVDQPTQGKHLKNVSLPGDAVRPE